MARAFEARRLSLEHIWFIPLDWIKLAMKATVIEKLRTHNTAAQLAEVSSTSGVRSRACSCARRPSTRACTRTA
ncbi:hypothetical protein DFH11DRAFT_1576487 [Phellopilus nigrolimitatus]|nr:hypothetical protein DFH11DRAFT_1576487 [Phellopilus nigrolimitatus]